MTSPDIQFDPETKKNMTPKLFFSTSGWIFKTLIHIAPKDTILLSGTTIISAAIPAAISYLSAKVIDEIIALASGGVSSLSDISLSDPLFLLIIASFSLLAIDRWLSNINEYLESKFQYYYLQMYENKVIEKISSFDVQQFENSATWDLIRKGRENIYKIRYFWNVSLRLLTRIVSLAISASIIFSLSIEISLLITALSIPTNLIASKYIRKLWDFYNSSTELRRTMWSLRSDAISESKIFEHKITGSNRYIARLLEKINASLLLRELGIYLMKFKASITVNFLGIIGDISYILFLIGKVLSGSITIGEFTFYQSRFAAFSGDINYIASQILTLSDSAFYATFVKNLMETEPTMKNGTTCIRTDTPPSIELKNVSFKYPGTSSYVLKDISMKIEPGDEIAIVGENGAGKTTLIKLILRFYDPTDGEILINGIPIQDIDRQSYYDTIGALFQEYAVYGSQNIARNIHIGDASGEMDMERVIAASKKADAHSFISKLEYGYEQILLRMFSKGTNLSTGQKQKVALARMFYRDRPILILDEPTASIDAEAEYKIFKRLYKFIEKKTLIVISHRFSTVRNAQKIYVIKDGKVAESGSHEELLKKKGLYEHAFSLQAEGYQKK